MQKRRVSIAGAASLLGHYLLARIAQDLDIVVESLHDDLAETGTQSIAQILDWRVDLAIRQAFEDVPFRRTRDEVAAPMLLSFLPEAGARETESLHIARGVRVISHCEYARSNAPLALPGISDPVEQAGFVSTPNCTTAMAAYPLKYLHQSFGVIRTTSTTMQAISGTDLPGLPASSIHDRIIGHMPSEADALSAELSLLFGHAFPITAFASRVPVWRGHTLTMDIELKASADEDALRSTLNDCSELCFADTLYDREVFSLDDPVSVITSLRTTPNGVALVVSGDNLGAATTGVMHKIAHAI